MSALYRTGILIFLLNLSACQTDTPKGTPTSAKEVQDSAPKGPVPTWFPRVIPHFEPLSRYGNPSHYAVNGKQYQVMNSARGYHAKGLASWYGTKFDKKRTSSGEPYNMYALTAAHKTLPLPTYLKVKNLDNGRDIIVKVNDRGPFHSERILDLSYGAAVKLGLFPRGVARVEIQTVSIPGQEKAHVAHYFLQVGAFQSRVSASNLQKQLRKWTSTPVSVETYNGHYVVKVGPFPNQGLANQLKSKLKVQGFKGVFSFLQ